MILYFSGTGNSEYVAKRIAQKTGDEVQNLFQRLRDNDHSEMNSEKPWVIVCPVYAWQMPHILRDWLLQTRLTGDDRIYFVMTCGSNIAGAGLYAKEVASQMGLTYQGTAPVVMPENYIAMFKTPDQEKALEIVIRAEESIDRIAELIAGEAYLEELGGGRLQSMLMNWGLYKFGISDKKFAAGDSCTACGQCVRICPTENIYLSGPEIKVPKIEKIEDIDQEEPKAGARRPVWSGRCIHCMACINRCPFQAIEYGTASVGKERYRCPKTL